MSTNPTDTYQFHLGQLQQKFARLEGPWLRAMEYLKSEEYVNDCIATLQKINKIVPKSRVEPSDAMLAVGRILQVLEDWNAQQSVIDEFNSVRESLSKHNLPNTTS